MSQHDDQTGSPRASFLLEVVQRQLDDEAKRDDAAQCRASASINSAHSASGYSLAFCSALVDARLRRDGALAEVKAGDVHATTAPIFADVMALGEAQAAPAQ